MYGHGFRPGKQQIKPANTEIAAAEKINPNLMFASLRLTLLALGIVEAILHEAAAGGTAARPPAAAVSSRAAGAADGA
jgi:hypothetical protein